jgi:hypothetical protein
MPESHASGLGGMCETEGDTLSRYETGCQRWLAEGVSRTVACNEMEDRYQKSRLLCVEPHSSISGKAGRQRESQAVGGVGNVPCQAFMRACMVEQGERRWP